MEETRKKYNPKPCVFNPQGVLCFAEDIKNNLCEKCGWNPEEYEKRVREIRAGSGKKP